MESKYEEWQRRDWLRWLHNNLVFPFQVERMEDDFYDTDEPFRVGHVMKVVGIEFTEDDDPTYGIIIKVKSGRKTGYIPLCDVEVTSRDDPNFWAVREYVVWFANQ
jgi:hypothetical protein